MKFIGIIPARYASTRFPGKPLALINGKPMVQWVYENTCKVLDVVYVATDDDRIYKAVEAFGGKVVMTATEHPSGTDRCAEALAAIEAELMTTFDVVINIQGDEPFVEPSQIEALRDCFTPDTELATLIGHVTSLEQLDDMGEAKVVLDRQGNAILFSRSPIPFVRGVAKSDWLSKQTFYRHIGLYGYRSDILRAITRLEPSPLELAESLEQLRWVENGYKIRCGISDIETLCVDTPQDLEKLLKTLR